MGSDNAKLSELIQYFHTGKRIKLSNMNRFLLVTIHQKN